MSSLRNVRVAFSSLKARALPRLLYSSSGSSIDTQTRLLPRRAFSVMADSRNDLFNYTSGRWLWNDALRHAERKLVFDVEGLRRLAAQSVDRKPADIVELSKLAEGGFKRIFLITFRDDFKMIARVPYPTTIPKYYAVASEVATMEFLRSYGLPIPKVYGYSPASDNEAKTEYILMEHLKGVPLGDVWMGLGEQAVASIISQVVQLESKMMSIALPAGGSLYYAHDLKKLGRQTVPLEDERFCVGPDTRLHMWYGRRSQLDVDRGPYETAEATLEAAAHKELAYLERFGQPLLPFRRQRRDAYQYQEQLPSAHIANLQSYLLMASSLVPRDPALSRFSIRHPDLQHNNIIVRWSADAGWQVVGLIDWQHACILPLFLLAGIPTRIQNHDDPVSQSMTPPSLPEDFDDLPETEQTKAMDVYHRRLGHYYYSTNTMEHNKPHYHVMTDPMYPLRLRLFNYAGYPWEGETFELELALIEATQKWDRLAGGGVPCPVVFDAEHVRKTMELNEKQIEADSRYEVWRGALGVGTEGWVSSEDYEQTVAICKLQKEEALADDLSEEERAEILGHWYWDDMDESKYM